MDVNEILARKIEELQKKLAVTEAEKEKLETLVDEKRLNNANRENKDRLFKFIFGNPENKEWTLSLYNAMNGTNYKDPEEIRFNTIEDVIYMRMKNDMSFIVGYEMDLWEAQSSYNPNIPMRFFIYAGALYDKYTANSNYNKFSSRLQSIPRPKCICFYNGRMDQPERKTLKLSDAYYDDGDIEVTVSMININYGKNKELMDACKPLKEYSWMVDSIRKYQSEMIDLDSAVDKMINEMPEDFLIKKFLVGHRAEVKMMFLTEYDEEKHMKQEREENYNEGWTEGRTEGINDTSKLMNYLWKNGKGDDAIKAEKDKNFMNELFEKYKNELALN